MSPVKSLEELKKLKEMAQQKRVAKATSGRAQIVVGMGTCGIAAGARDTMKAILEVIEKQALQDIIVTQTGCIGRCDWEPIVEVTLTGEEKVTYGKVNREAAQRIMQEHVLEGTAVHELVVPS